MDFIKVSEIKILNLRFYIGMKYSTNKPGEI